MRIASEYIHQLRAAATVEDLYPLVQKAIELEHATIPPYLCGYFTLKIGSNEDAGQIIRSVVIEEMLHFSLASNLLLALGGAPQIDTPDFVPKYPGELPFKIGDHLEVHLRKCSIAQVQDVFMAIEKPDVVIDIPTATAGRMNLAAIDVPDEFATIGLFYEFLAQKIREIDASTPITWHTDKQNVASQWFTDPDEMFLIDSTDAAVKAIGVIVDQGEGTHTDPFDTDGVPAHYYRFEEIVRGRRLIPKPGAVPPYEFGGLPVYLDAEQIWDMDDDPAIAKYAAGTVSHRMATQFSYSYTRALNALHLAFNGEKAQIDHAMGVMYELRLLAQQVLATPAVYADGSSNDAGKGTGLSFEYVEVNE